MCKQGFWSEREKKSASQMFPEAADKPNEASVKTEHDADL